jgi:hypothetical protein
MTVEKSGRLAKKRRRPKPEMMQSAVDHQEVLKEEAAVQSAGEHQEVPKEEAAVQSAGEHQEVP